MAAILMAVGMNAQILEEDFESGTFPPSGWEVIDNHPNTDSNWHSVEADGNNFATLLYSDTQMMDEWLISPSIDLSSATSVELTFDFFMSYNWMVAQSGADLNVKVSSDGGTTWDQLWREEDASDYFNNVNQNFTWIPVAPIDLSAYEGESDVKVAFNFLGDDGAETRVDNFAVSGTLSISDNNINGFNYFFSTQSKNLTINANNAFSSISIFNVLGQEVVNKNLSSTSEVINLASLNNGIYIANVISNGQKATFKLIKR